MRDGLLIVDKPQGITSHDVVNRIRRVSGIRRVGHAGTLDPLATGVLLIFVGRMTRLSEYLLAQPKMYAAEVRLGQSTDTYDAEGKVVAERPYHVSQADILAAIPAFQGNIQQQPPMYSAVKRQGQPLYKLARQGVVVERPYRDVTIYQLEVITWEPPYLQIHVSCSAGTYIRSLAHDLGESLGCGGHITALRRTSIGDLTLESAVSLEMLDEQNWCAYLQPGDTAVAHLPALNITVEESEQLKNGQCIPYTPSHPQAPLVRVYAPDGDFIGIAAAREQMWQPRKIFS